MDTKADVETSDCNVVPDLVLEMLEVLVHQIVYISKLYPTTIFERRRKYNIPVWMSIHPEVNTYIRSSLLQLKKFMSEGSLREIHITFYNDRGKSNPVDRFVFTVQYQMLDGHPSSQSSGNLDVDPFLYDLEQKLRSIILQLSSTPFKTHTFTEEARFGIEAVVTAASAAGIDQTSNPWTITHEDESTVDERVITPITYPLNIPTMKIQLYVETQVKL